MRGLLDCAVRLDRNKRGRKGNLQSSFSSAKIKWMMITYSFSDSIILNSMNETFL